MQMPLIMRIAFIALFLFTGYISFAQSPEAFKVPLYKARITRADSVDIVFTFQLKKENNKPVVYIINGDEKIKLDKVDINGDSVNMEMPVFESSFKAKITGTTWSGTWTRGTSGNDLTLPFHAEPSASRFAAVNGNPLYNITGRWASAFANDKTKADGSVAEFVQKGDKLTGTFLTPSGDDRYLEGIVTGNTLKLSGFDGIHALVFTADITSNNTIENGMYYSGAKYKEAWKAVKDPKATVITDSFNMQLKPGEDRLSFTFPDLDGKPVSINDAAYKNKVVILQIMGSWCPNCMDEMKFLSAYYDANKQRGVEIIGLAYEYSTDFDRSVKGLRKFQKQFDVKYPMLVTGAKVSDSLKTEKTLPQVSPIKVFPSSIIIDKQGKVRKFDSGFVGPGTGSHYEDYKKEFAATIDELLKE